MIVEVEAETGGFARILACAQRGGSDFRCSIKDRKVFFIPAAQLLLVDPACFPAFPAYRTNRGPW